MKKTYGFIRYGRGRNFLVGLGKKVYVSDGYTTEDEDIQNVIEKSKSFKEGVVFLKPDQATEPVEGDPVVTEGPPVDPPKTKVGSEDAIPAEPGKKYGLHNLRAMTVPELRGICGQQGKKWRGLKKADLIKLLLGG